MIKKIDKVNLLVNFIFSTIMGLILTFVFDIHWYHLSYWVISTLIQIALQGYLKQITGYIRGKMN
jgi:hypothetical protein